MNVGGINASSYTGKLGFSPVPEGTYQVILTKSDLEPTERGGQKIVFEAIIQGGNQHSKAIIFSLNWVNDNPKAVEMGRNMLAALATVCNIQNLQDTQQLHNIPFMMEVSITPDGKYNNVVDVKPIQHNQPSVMQGNVPSQYPQAQQGPPPGLQRPTNPNWIQNAGTPNEQWWSGTAWVPAPQQQAQQGPPPGYGAPPPQSQPVQYQQPPHAGYGPPAGAGPQNYGPPPGGAAPAPDDTPDWIKNQQQGYPQ